jgi:hypothetical protein
MDAKERKTYVTPMLNKIGTVNEFTKGNGVDPSAEQQITRPGGGSIL